MPGDLKYSRASLLNLSHSFLIRDPVYLPYVRKKRSAKPSTPAPKTKAPAPKSESPAPKAEVPAPKTEVPTPEPASMAPPPPPPGLMDSKYASPSYSSTAGNTRRAPMSARRVPKSPTPASDTTTPVAAGSTSTLQPVKAGQPSASAAQQAAATPQRPLPAFTPPSVEMPGTRAVEIKPPPKQADEKHDLTRKVTNDKATDTGKATASMAPAVQPPQQTTLPDRTNRSSSKASATQSRGDGANIQRLIQDAMRSQARPMPRVNLPKTPTPVASPKPSSIQSAERSSPAPPVAQSSVDTTRLDVPAELPSFAPEVVNKYIYALLIIRTKFATLQASDDQNDFLSSTLDTPSRDVIVTCLNQLIDELTSHKAVGKTEAEVRKRLQKRLEEAEATVAKLRQKEKSYENGTSSLSPDLWNDLNAKAKEFQSKNGQLQSDNDGLKSQVTALQSENGNLRSEKQRLQDELRASQQARPQAQQTTATAQQTPGNPAAAPQTGERSEEILKALRKRIAELEKQAFNLGMDVGMSDEKVRAAENLKNNVQKENLRLKKENESVKEVNAKLQTDSARVEKENQKLTQDNRSLGRNNERLVDHVGPVVARQILGGQPHQGPAPPVPALAAEGTFPRMHARIKELEAENAQLKSSGAGQSNNVPSDQTQGGSSSNDVDVSKLQRENEELKQRNADLEQTDFVRKNKYLGDIIKDYEKENEDLRARMPIVVNYDVTATFQAESHRLLEVDNRLLKGRVADLVKTKAELESEVAELKEKLADQELESRDLAVKGKGGELLRSISTQLEEAEQKKDELQAENVVLRSEVADHQILLHNVAKAVREAEEVSQEEARLTNGSQLMQVSLEQQMDQQHQIRASINASLHDMLLYHVRQMLAQLNNVATMGITGTAHTAEEFSNFHAVLDTRAEENAALRGLLRRMVGCVQGLQQGMGAATGVVDAGEEEEL